LALGGGNPEKETNKVWETGESVRKRVKKKKKTGELSHLKSFKALWQRGVSNKTSRKGSLEKKKTVTTFSTAHGYRRENLLE